MKHSIKFYLFKYKWYTVIFISAILFSLLIGKIVECGLYFIAYISLRYLFPKTFHHKNFYGCIFWSIMMMISAVYSVMNIGVSLISSVLLSFIVGYLLYRIQDYIDLKSSVDDEAILRSQCRKAGLSANMTEFAVDYLIKRLSAKEQAEKTGYSVQTVKNYRSAVKKKIKIAE